MYSSVSDVGPFVSSHVHDVGKPVDVSWYCTGTSGATIFRCDTASRNDAGQRNDGTGFFPVTLTKPSIVFTSSPSASATFSVTSYCPPLV